MTDRCGAVSRKTNETSMELELNLDGRGRFTGTTGIGFLDHMLQLMAMHGGLDMDLSCQGDIEVDNHHLVEDLGIVMGKALNKALGDKRGIARYALAYTPMDESLVMVCVDISGRPYLHYNLPLTREYVGQLETEMVEEFFRAFTMNSKITLHINLMYGTNNHHMIEALFKGMGRALKEAVYIKDAAAGVMSTKGSL